MKYLTFKAFLFLFFLFFVDMLKPLGYSLLIDFLFLGIVYLALNYPLRTLVILSILFGYLSDVFSQNTVSFSMMEYLFVSLLAYYLRSNLLLIDKKFESLLTKTCIAILLFSIHICLGLIKINNFAPIFAVQYLIQITVIYLILNPVLKKTLNYDPAVVF